jgi:hypothetical protein
MIVSFRSAVPDLLGRECKVLTGVRDHLAHLANAFGTLCRALIARENVTRSGRACLDREGDVTLAKTIAVADVHGRGVPDQS